MRIVFALLSLLLLILPVEFQAQTAELDEIQKDKKLVSVPVSISDREGRYIPGLKKEDFTVYQDGVKQKISFFATYDEPLNIALLLDTSGSTEEALGKIKDAAKDFIELLNPNDQCLLATFDYKLNVLSSFTSDQKLLKKSLNQVHTVGQNGTILRNAIDEIAGNSFANAEGRKVIVLLSDGKDLGSSITKDDLMSRLEESDILIYSIFYKTGIGFKKVVIDADGKITEGKKSKKPKKKKIKKFKGYSVSIPSEEDLPSDETIKMREQTADIEAINSLKEMSDITAGRFYLSSTPDLNEIFKKVAGELREQYRIGYRSKDAANRENAIHEINVKVERMGAVVRARGKFRAKQL